MQIKLNYLRIHTNVIKVENYRKYGPNSECGEWRERDRLAV